MSPPKINTNQERRPTPYKRIWGIVNSMSQILLSLQRKGSARVRTPYFKPLYKHTTGQRPPKGQPDPSQLSHPFCKIFYAFGKNFFAPDACRNDRGWSWKSYKRMRSTSCGRLAEGTSRSYTISARCAWTLQSVSSRCTLRWLVHGWQKIRKSSTIFKIFYCYRVVHITIIIIIFFVSDHHRVSIMIALTSVNEVRCP